MDKRVRIDFSRPFKHDENYRILTLSAVEVYEEDSPTLAAALRFLRPCIDSYRKPHLRHLIFGECRVVRLLADNLNSFHTSFVSFVDRSSPSRKVDYAASKIGVAPSIEKNRRNQFEAFTIQLFGPFNEVRRAFVEAINELRTKVFTPISAYEQN